MKEAPYHPCPPLSMYQYHHCKTVFCCSNARTGGWGAEKEEEEKNRTGRKEGRKEGTDDEWRKRMRDMKDS